MIATDAQALAEAVTAIVRAHPELVGAGEVTIRVVALENGWHEVYADDRVLGGVAPETIAERADRIRVQRN